MSVEVRQTSCTASGPKGALARRVRRPESALFSRLQRSVPRCC